MPMPYALSGHYKQQYYKYPISSELIITPINSSEIQVTVSITGIYLRSAPPSISLNGSVKINNPTYSEKGTTRNFMTATFSGKASCDWRSLALSQTITVEVEGLSSLWSYGHSSTESIDQKILITGSKLTALTVPFVSPLMPSQPSCNYTKGRCWYHLHIFSHAQDENYTLSNYYQEVNSKFIFQGVYGSLYSYNWSSIPVHIKYLCSSEGWVMQISLNAPISPEDPSQVPRFDLLQITGG